MSRSTAPIGQNIGISTAIAGRRSRRLTSPRLEKSKPITSQIYPKRQKHSGKVNNLRDSNLRTFDIKLRDSCWPWVMDSKLLDTKEVVSRGNAGGDVECVGFFIKFSMKVKL